LPFVTPVLCLGFRYKGYHLIGLLEIHQPNVDLGCLPLIL